MKVVLDIQDSKADYILSWLRQFNFVKIKERKEAVAPKVEAKKKVAPQDNPAANNMQELLLNGPVMTDVEYREFLEKRKHLNTWK